MVELQQSEPAQAQQPVAAGENNVTVVVLDSCLYPSPPKRKELQVPRDITGGTLKAKIADELGYNKDSFDAKDLGGKISIEDDDSKPLELMSGPKFVLSLSKRPGAKDEFKPKAVSTVFNEHHSSVSTTSPSTAVVTYGTTYGPNLPSSSSSSYNYPSNNYSSGSNYSSGYTSSYSSSYSWSQPAGKSSTGYIGLSNQGATCYMNSLIQSLFMTPEFRNALYNWSFDEKHKVQNGNGKAPENPASPAPATPPPATPPASEENANGTGPANGTVPTSSANGATQKAVFTPEEREKKEKSSIPLQLQRLFARLQLCDVQAVKTKDLTKSFGWEDADAFTQHDVQELCRVLFDALEKNFQGTKQANLVNDLYQGKMKDYVQCKECGHESARIDHYLDIPLVIRGFGETVPVRSVEEALHKFVTPEILDKDNQYSCEKCNKKVDAVKGLRIEKFPYLLTLQLKRFDFDFQTMRRIKLNDRVTFPLYLDLNPFISGKHAPMPPKPQKEKEKDEEEEEEEDEEDEEDEKENKDKETNNHEEPQSQTDGNGKKDMDHEDGPAESHKKENNNHDNFNAEPDFDAPAPVCTAELPYVYELFSVMIHRGSSMGGHYYAYIKSFETGKWYEFNDSMVSEINLSDVKKAFGGDEEGYSRSVYSSYRSNANAYMLMYRQIDPERNTKPMTTTEIPAELKKVIEEENGAAKQKKKAEELEREMVKMKIFYNGEEKPLSMHKSASLNDTAKAAVNLFGLGDKYAPGNYRLRNYTQYHDLPGETYTDKENKSLDDLNFTIGQTYTSKSLLLETKEAHEEFDEYDASMMLFRVAKYDVATQGFGPTLNVYVSKVGTLGDLREAVEKKTGVPKEKQNLYKEASYTTWGNPPASILSKPDETDIRNFHFMEPEKLYVEYSERPATTEDEDGDNEAEKEESPVIAALERIKNIIEVKYNLPGKEDADQKISVDKNITLKEFKEKIATTVGLSVDDFKVKRGSGTHLYELITESDSLADCNIRDGMSLTIEKGRPLKEGESNYMFEFFDLSKEADNFTDLFEIPVHEDILIADLKKLIAPMLVEKNIPVSDPSHIRLRDVSSSQYSRRVGKAFPDGISLKKATMYIYSKRVAVQVLTEPETVQDAEKDLVIFVQHFANDKFELSKKEDFVINEDASLDEFREKLGAKYGIEPQNVSVVKVDNYYSFYDDPDLLEIPDMKWDKPTVLYSTKNTVGDTMMMRNGNLVIIRDNSVPLKELNEKEKDAIKKEMSKRKNTQNSSSSSYSYWNRKEKALKIHTAE